MRDRSWVHPLWLIFYRGYPLFLTGMREKTKYCFLIFSTEKRANFDYNRVFGHGEFNDRRGERRAASRIALSADRHSVLIDNLFKFIRHAITIRYFIISFNLQRFIKSISKIHHLGLPLIRDIQVHASSCTNHFFHNLYFPLFCDGTFLTFYSLFTLCFKITIIIYLDNFFSTNFRQSVFRQITSKSCFR